LCLLHGVAEVGRDEARRLKRFGDIAHERVVDLAHEQFILIDVNGSGSGVHLGLRLTGRNQHGNGEPDQGDGRNEGPTQTVGSASRIETCANGGLLCAPEELWTLGGSLHEFAEVGESAIELLVFVTTHVTFVGVRLGARCDEVFGEFVFVPMRFHLLSALHLLADGVYRPR
jgi:hypothetical protein